jgi:hypothetical protein
MGKYFHYGLVGNLIFYGGTMLIFGWTIWMVNDMTEKHSVKMSAELFK